MDTSWKTDPRLKNMSPEKLQYLTHLAETAEQTPKDRLMPLFMSIASGAGRFQFSDDETDLIVSIMTSRMSAAEKKKVEMLRTLSKRFGAKKSGGRTG